MVVTSDHLLPMWLSSFCECGHKKYLIKKKGIREQGINIQRATRTNKVKTVWGHNALIIRDTSDYTGSKILQVFKLVETRNFGVFLVWSCNNCETAMEVSGGCLTRLRSPPHSPQSRVQEAFFPFLRFILVFSLFWGAQGVLAKADDRIPG